MKVGALIVCRVANRQANLSQDSARSINGGYAYIDGKYPSHQKSLYNVPINILLFLKPGLVLLELLQLFESDGRTVKWQGNEIGIHYNSVKITFVLL